MHANHKILFEPVKLGPVTTRNRFYQVPHGLDDGNFLDVARAIRGVRAEGGWGVVCTGSCSIHPSSDYNYYGLRRLWNDGHVKEQAATAEEIHRHGALAGIELAHYGMGAANDATKLPIWAPSRQIAFGERHFPRQAQAIDRETIRNLLTWQREAAVRAKKAGFDIVYVYSAADMSLPMQFLSPFHNRRTDEYGGSLENRSRLLRQMIEVTKDAVGDRCAVAVRLSVDRLVSLDGTSTEREGCQVVEMLAELPDLWDVNLVDWSDDSLSSRFGKEARQEEFVSFVKQCTTKPVVGVGRFTSPDTMASQIRRGVLDLVGAARPSIADPFLPRKVEEGRTDDIRECIGCNYCIKTHHQGVVVGCTQNPTMGQEWRLGWHPERIQPKPEPSQARVLVVGGGPSGLEATRALVQRGYRVTLAEASGQLGGRVKREATLPGLQEWIRVADWRLTQILRSPEVDVYKNNAVTAAHILGFDHEHVVIATGSKWRRDGVGLANRVPLVLEPAARIFTPDDLMEGRFPDCGPVVVFDDDHYYLGGVLAEQLRRRNLDVQLVTPGHTISKYTAGSLEAGHVLKRMRELGIQMNVHSNLLRVDRNDVTLISMLSGEATIVPAAAVVLVTSRDPVDDLYQELMAQPQRLNDSGIRTVTVIGDAKVPDTIASAVFDGHRYARELEGIAVDVASLPPSKRSLY